MVTTFLKVVCEQVSPIGKSILVDENCKDVKEASAVLSSHPELFGQDKTWILYPMSVSM